MKKENKNLLEIPEHAGKEEKIKILSAYLKDLKDILADTLAEYDEADADTETSDLLTEALDALEDASEAIEEAMGGN